MNKPKIARKEFELVGKEYITPHYIRVTLQCDDISPYANCTLGVNNKIMIPPTGVDRVYFPTLTKKGFDHTSVEEHLRPIIRTYTHRYIDLEKNQLQIDFVHHGENGPASAWAIHAEKGDKIGVVMKAQKTELYPPADWYFLIGDATAIPVIASILESLPQDAKGIVLLETPTKEDEQNLQKPDGITIKWLHNLHPEKGSELAKIAQQHTIPSIENKFAYVAAEFSTVKVLRNYFRKELGWTRDELYAYSYWKAGFAEDKSVTSREEEKNSFE
ncbi:Vibriobactin utilization protein ViuB [Weeksella virosa]|uniref:siderophore-interacting protein n=1 Tax=Weeksella virosa TaxID=1014 RepID=UPI000E046976|nr:siderophore-interacting protein [Weeksella virosa]SUP54049.1 Vibriobactin utilization protein ViuB [Weeksella virosa]